MKPFKKEKIYYSIKEVSELLNVSYTTLRYWESEFESLHPRKTDKGTRQYKKEDIEEIRLIHHLVKQKKMTIAGARQKLKGNRDSVVKVEEIVSRLENIRQELLLLKQEFDTLEGSDI
jgi:DNA-binding transcriptional MerR regulator